MPVQVDTPARREEALAQAAFRLAQAAIRQEWIAEPETMPATIEDAYVVQDIASALRPDQPVGWKIGCTSEHVQTVFKVDTPIAGRIFHSELFQSPAIIRRVRRERLIVEGEFVFRLARDLLPRETPYQRDEILAAIGALHPGIEYVQSRYSGPPVFNAIRSVVDNSGFGALVIGPEVSDWDPETLPAQAVTIWSDGREIAKGFGRDVLGNPIACLEWLVRFLNQRGRGLRTGDYVTTGSCTGAERVELDQEVIADFGSLGRVSVTFSQ